MLSKGYFVIDCHSQTCHVVSWNNFGALYEQSRLEIQMTHVLAFKDNFFSLLRLKIMEKAIMSKIVFT